MEKEFTIKPSDGKQYFDKTKEISEYVDNVLKVIDLNRQSDGGNYVQF